MHICHIIQQIILYIPVFGKTFDQTNEHVKVQSIEDRAFYDPTFNLTNPGYSLSPYIGMNKRRSTY